MLTFSGVSICDHIAEESFPDDVFDTMLLCDLASRLRGIGGVDGSRICHSLDWGWANTHQNGGALYDPGVSWRSWRI
jgi:hypothetical protein